MFLISKPPEFTSRKSTILKSALQMTRICMIVRYPNCLQRLVLYVLLLLFLCAVVFAGRYALSKFTQTPEDDRIDWSESEKDAFKRPVSTKELLWLTEEQVERRIAGTQNPYKAWVVAKKARSVPLRIGEASESLRNAEHYLWARFFVSCWDSKPARGIAATGAVVAVGIWSIAKIFETYSPPTAAEMQSGIDGALAGFWLEGQASKMPGADYTPFYPMMPYVNGILCMLAIVLGIATGILVIRLIPRIVKACKKRSRLVKLLRHKKTAEATRRF